MEQYVEKEKLVLQEEHEEAKFSSKQNEFDMFDSPDWKPSYRKRRLGAYRE